MTNEAMRFLALNAVLHGHPVVDAFEGSFETMAKALDTTEEEATRLNNAIQALPDVAPSEDRMVLLFLNFYRNNSYTFVTMGDNVFTLAKFAATDREGQVPADLREVFISNLCKDVRQDMTYLNPTIVDGMLLCIPEDFARVDKAMAQAYSLYLYGPAGFPKSLVNTMLRYTSLEFYNRVSSSMMLKTLRQMAKLKVSPTIYQKTMVQTPDLLDVYQRTGCIISFRDTTHTTLNWLLDVADVADSTIVLSVNTDTLKNYLLRDIRDLAGIKAVRRGGESGTILFPGVS